MTYLPTLHTYRMPPIQILKLDRLATSCRASCIRQLGMGTRTMYMPSHMPADPPAEWFKVQRFSDTLLPCGKDVSPPVPVSVRSSLHVNLLLVQDRRLEGCQPQTSR